MLSTFPLKCVGSKLTVLSIFFIAHSLAGSSRREKRGASVYPVFMGNNQGGHGAEQNNFLYLHDPTPFIQYLGGSSTTSSSGPGYNNNRHGASNSQTSPSTYSFSVQPAPAPMHMMSSSSSGGGGTSTPFDLNFLNSYAMASRGQGHMGSGSTSTGSGWSPNLGYTQNFYTTDYGMLSPNFANSPSTSASTMHGHRATLPTLSANSLAHSAQMSFNAQNHLYDVLLSGSRPSYYKGSAV